MQFYKTGRGSNSWITVFGKGSNSKFIKKYIHKCNSTNRIGKLLLIYDKVYSQMQFPQKDKGCYS